LTGVAAIRATMIVARNELGRWRCENGARSRYIVRPSTQSADSMRSYITSLRMHAKCWLLAFSIVLSTSGCGNNGETSAVPTVSLTTGAHTYATDFDLTENPISENGVWTNGLAVGLDWNDIQTVSGNAIGTQFTPSSYADNLAHLSGYPSDHYIEGVVHRVRGYNPTQVHEIELLVRFQITANTARGYEILMDSAGNFQIVRWNGPVGDFTVLRPEGPGTGTIVDGDVIRVEVSGSVITVYKNGSKVAFVMDVIWATGEPGIGIFTRGGDSVLASMGWQSIEAGSL
jgi:hypothetical protein